MTETVLNLTILQHFCPGPRNFPVGKDPLFVHTHLIFQVDFLGVNLIDSVVFFSLLLIVIQAVSSNLACLSRFES